MSTTNNSYNGLSGCCDSNPNDLQKLSLTGGVITLSKCGGSVDISGLFGKNIVIDDAPGISFTRTETATTITFTPTLDFEYICSQCAPIPPCPVLSFSASEITNTSFTLTVVGVQMGSTYDVSINNGVSFILLSQTLAVIPITGLTPGTAYSVVIRNNCTTGTATTSTSTTVTTTTTTTPCPAPTDVAVTMSA